MAFHLQNVSQSLTKWPLRLKSTLSASPQVENYVLVAHGITIATLMMRLENYPIDDFGPLSLPHRRVAAIASLPHCLIARLLEAGGARIVGKSRQGGRTV